MQDENEYTIRKNSKSIKEWREDERPREKLIKNGASILSDSELLAILISSGTKGYSALDIARDLIDKHNNLTGLSTCDISEFKQFKGLKSARAVTLSAAFEIAKRIQSEPFANKKSFNGPEDVANYYIPRLRGKKHEVFLTLLLNSANQVFREVVVSSGILNSSIVHAREVFKIAITESAAAIILLHNHPSGNPEPSKEDIAITKQLVGAGKIIGIEVLDHIIVADDDYSSFAQLSLI